MSAASWRRGCGPPAPARCRSPRAPARPRGHERQGHEDGGHDDRRVGEEHLEAASLERRPEPAVAPAVDQHQREADDDRRHREGQIDQRAEEAAAGEPVAHQQQRHAHAEHRVDDDGETLTHEVSCSAWFTRGIVEACRAGRRARRRTCSWRPATPARPRAGTGRRSTMSRRGSVTGRRGAAGRARGFAAARRRRLVRVGHDVSHGVPPRCTTSSSTITTSETTSRAWRPRRPPRVVVFDEGQDSHRGDLGAVGEVAESSTSEPYSLIPRAKESAAPALMAGVRRGRMIRRKIVKRWRRATPRPPRPRRSSSSSTGCTVRTTNGRVTNSKRQEHRASGVGDVDADGALRPVQRQQHEAGHDRGQGEGDVDDHLEHPLAEELVTHQHPGDQRAHERR